MNSKTKEGIYIVIIILLLGLCAQFFYSYQYRPRAQREIKVYYNQEHELNKEIIQLTRDADKFVYFAIYTFTRNDIKDALLAAKYRGLEVIGLTDNKQLKEIVSQRKIVKELTEAGIPVYTQDHTAIMHLKVIVTDKGYASGSFNWTSAATNLNDEVLEVGKDQNIRGKFEDILKKMFAKYKTVN